MPGCRFFLLHRVWFCAVLAAAAAVDAAHAGGLPPEVDTALAQAQVPREALVALVQEVGSGEPRLSWQAQAPMNPASLMKLVTTSAALDRLGPAWTWATPVWLQGRVRNGVLDGDLLIKGSGDPTLVQERVWLLLRRVQQLGVREIRGDIVLDRSAFALPAHDPAEFDGDPLRPSNVGPDALLLNYKSLLLTFTPDAERSVAVVSSEPPLAGVRIDTSVPLSTGACEDWRKALLADLSDAKRVHFGGHYPGSCGEQQWPLAYADPASFDARMLAGLWHEMGGRLSGRVRDGTAPSDPPSFVLSSRSLAEVIRDINKFSNNVMAQQLFLSLALAQRGRGTPEAAREVLQQWLSEHFGDEARCAVFDGGSGLSRETRITAQLLARVLQWSYASPTMPELMSSLPITGTDGTLRRMRNGATGLAHLKTGSLRDVSALAGYVLGQSGKRYVLVGIINHANALAGRAALDALVQWAAADLAALPATQSTAGARETKP